MAVGTIGLLDFSIVTDALRDMLDACIQSSPLFQSNGGPVADFTLTVTGDAPEVVKLEDGAYLSLHLFHVAEDRFQKNALLSNPTNGYARSQPIPQQPLAVDLYYLLTSFDKAGYVKQQQAMSIAMRCFHENPIVVTTVPFGAANPEQFTLTMEPLSLDEASRLWQGVSSPLHLSAVYRVGVVFVSPEPPLPPAPKVSSVRLGGGSAQAPFAAAGGQVLGTRTIVTYRPADSTVATPRTASYPLSPATVQAGDVLVLLGGGLAGKHVYLVDAAGTESDVTAWINPAAEAPTDSRIALSLPGAPGVPPGGSPEPGMYGLRVGTGSARSNSVPVGVAARVTGVGNPPILHPAGGTFTVAGDGFAGSLEIVLGTVPLAAGGPGAGFFQVGGGGTQVQFQLPAGLPTGTYPLRVRAAGVESHPSWWVVVP